MPGGRISVRAVLEASKRAAEKDVRRQIKDIANQHGVKLVGSPDIETEESIPGFWNGKGSQEYKR